MKKYSITPVVDVTGYPRCDFLVFTQSGPNADAAAAGIEAAARVRKTQLHYRAPAALRGLPSTPRDIPFRNLNSSLSVDRTRVVFSAMMDLQARRSTARRSAASRDWSPVAVLPSARCVSMLFNSWCQRKRRWRLRVYAGWQGGCPA